MPLPGTPAIDLASRPRRRLRSGKAGSLFPSALKIEHVTESHRLQRRQGIPG